MQGEMPPAMTYREFVTPRAMRALCRDLQHKSNECLPPHFH